MNNYRKTPEGVIQQIDRKPFQYVEEYIEKIYPGDEHKFRYTNYLRLGYVVGALGRIPSSILEVGYGKGYFLEACSKVVPSVYGYDIAKTPVPEGCKKVSEEDFLNKHYDVICFWDALEHFEDPSFIKDLDCEMIAVSLPWCHYNSIEYWDGIEKADEWFENWKHRKPDEHLWHFDDFSLIEFFNKNGYTRMTEGVYLEDVTRGGAKENPPNILTCAFKKN